LSARGWTQGKNLAVDTVVTAPQQEKAADMAGELIAKGADILVVVGTANAVAAKQASVTVPVVMLASGYPVEAGLAKSLARPAGNVTGLTVYAGTEIFGKSVALAKELAPALRELGVFWAYAPPAFPEIETEICRKEISEAAEALKIRVHFWTNRNARDLDASLIAAASSPVQALLMTSGGPQSTPEGIAKVAHFCEKRRLPAVADVASVIFRAAGVAAYSPDFSELGMRGASFVDRIFRGAKPGELPIEHPTRLQLHVNPRRAKLIGLTFPPAILARADRVIE
jgi:putative ABC transport system substrate-binding protein